LATGRKVAPVSNPAVERLLSAHRLVFGRRP
jgi:hypothetical protein